MFEKLQCLFQRLVNNQEFLAMGAFLEDRRIMELMIAAGSGFVDEVKSLIASGVDMNAKSISGNTAAMYASAHGQFDVIMALLDAGANILDSDEKGHTPLMVAACAGHVKLVSLLLQAGPYRYENYSRSMIKLTPEEEKCQKERDHKLQLALIAASIDGHDEVASLLLRYSAPLNRPTNSCESSLTFAACGNHMDLALVLLERGADVNEVNEKGYTPLMEAACEGHEEMIALCLNQGSIINAKHKKTGETALTLACSGGFLFVAEVLIECGANVELGAFTPLMEAALEGHLDLVRFLIKKEADVNARTKTGDTALTCARKNGHTDVADLLLESGARSNEPESEDSRSPSMKKGKAGLSCQQRRRRRQLWRNQEKITLLNPLYLEPFKKECLQNSSS